ncbi:MAG: hypothetical protein JWQ33_855 [Ramlibacter sp.]|nr:hypothetical protein [Ramlibacter sp.]
MSLAAPSLVAQWPAEAAPASHRGVGLTLINFNTAVQTLRCLDSIARSDEPPAWVLVLDNASEPADFRLLAEGCRNLGRSSLRLYRSEANLGFAGGSNFLIDRLMAEADFRFVGLINNDAVAKPCMVTRLADAMGVAPSRIGLTGGRMHRLHAPAEVDTLGIAIYASLMPADRRSTSDPYLGPTGGCCLIARELIAELVATCGYCFDERFFCYCEDTDLVLRANLLGYQPAYVDEVVALHEGQASSGGGHNGFIAYHGLRNAIWMHMKLMPASILAKHAGWLLLAHLGIVFRYVSAGHARLLLSVYVDAFSQRKVFADERRRFRRHVKLSSEELSRRFSPRFYRQGYFRLVVAQMLARRAKKPA